VRRTDPPLYGLEVVRVQDGTLFDSHPLWFPLDLTPDTIVMSATGSSIAVRCADERFLLDTSKVDILPLVPRLFLLYACSIVSIVIFPSVMLLHEIQESCHRALLKYTIHSLQQIMRCSLCGAKVTYTLV